MSFSRRIWKQVKRLKWLLLVWLGVECLPNTTLFSCMWIWCWWKGSCRQQLALQRVFWKLGDVWVEIPLLILQFTSDVRDFHFIDQRNCFLWVTRFLKTLAKVFRKHVQCLKVVVESNRLWTLGARHTQNLLIHMTKAIYFKVHAKYIQNTLLTHTYIHFLF